MILPPRGRTSRKGVFSTRSPHRPNPIGISAIPLLSRKGPYLIVGESDLIDGTPILDIKPYLPYADSFTDASLGWMAKTEEAERLLPSYQVTLSRLAHEQLNWLKMNYQIDFLSKAISILERDPHPHRTRRITRSRGGILQLACGPWRVIYELEESTVTIERIAAGYPHRVFSDPKYAEVADRVAQEAFVQIWP